MSEITAIATGYFSPPRGFFWQWAEKGTAIEWKNGKTICYTADLLNILRGLSEMGLPPLGTVLLLLSACQHGGDESGWGNWPDFPEASPSEGIDRAFRIHPLAKALLNDVQALPADLRTGNNRIHLIREIIAAQLSKNGVIPVPAHLSPAVIDEWTSGRLDSAVFAHKNTDSGRSGHLLDIIPLAFARRKFPDVHTLEYHLRAGLPTPPPPLELPLPDPQPQDLLDELAEDPKTAGLAQLTRHLLAALNTPMHARGASDLPIGGVADISNRGDFDRLLLSELANDDLTLTARLVNNEALFLRREEPPANLDRQRTILVDTTLKMWGMQRVFALSAALAFARNTHHVTAVRAFALGGRQHQALDLDHKPGVLNALEQLDAALHCGEALTRFFAEMPKKNAENEDFILISDADVLRDERFQAVFSEARSRLRFLIALRRDGSLQFFEFIEGRGKLIGQPRFDLEELLFPKPKTRPNPIPSELPAFFRCEPTPLFFPLTAVQLNRENTIFDRRHGAVIVTDHRRALHWPNEYSGARELLPFIEQGKLCSGFGGDGEIFFLVHDPAQLVLKLYSVCPDGTRAELIVHDSVRNILAMAYDNGTFLLTLPTDTLCIDALTGRKSLATSDTKVFVSNFERRQNSLHIVGIKQFIQHNYSTIQRVKSIYITSNGELAAGSHYLRLMDQDRLKWTATDGTNTAEPRNVQTSALPENPQSLLYERTWPNGSQAIADSRGFLHLRSANPALPEVTILLIADAMTAAWADDGAVCGSECFINTAAAGNRIPADTFYNQYIKSFITGLS